MTSSTHTRVTHASHDNAANAMPHQNAAVVEAVESPWGHFPDSARRENTPRSASVGREHCVTTGRASAAEAHGNPPWPRVRVTHASRLTFGVVDALIAHRVRR